MKELGGAKLGDKRRVDRLVQLADDLARHPGESIPAALSGWADVKAAYRFFDNGEVEAAAIFEEHRQSTLARLRGHERVLVVHDTTVFNFTSHPKTRGLGPIGGRPLLGLFLHSALAVSLDGQPLGLVGRRVWARDEREHKVRHAKRKELPVEEKESQRWLALMREAAQGASPRMIHVADREADMYEFFTTAQSLGHDFLVRATHNRRVMNNAEDLLWDAMEKAAVVGSLDLEVARTHERPARTARLSIRTARITLHPPSQRPASVKHKPIDVNVVIAREENPPDGESRIEWKLLTSLPVTTLQDAAECLRLYALRWLIERFHYTLKSGANIEELQLEAADRLERAFALYCVVGWRLLATTYKARTSPSVSCTEEFSDAEWRVLSRHFLGRIPKKPPQLHTAVAWVARLGGFLARKGDGNPGVKVIWRGFRRLADMTIGHEEA